MSGTATPRVGHLGRYVLPGHTSRPDLGGGAGAPEAAQEASSTNTATTEEVSK
jgi:hypothetical protein